MHRKPSTTTKSGWTCPSASLSTGRSTEPSLHMKSTWSVRLYLYAAAFATLSALGCAAQTVIYEKASPYNTIIVTEDHKCLRTLLFESGGWWRRVVEPGDPDHRELPYAQVEVGRLAICGEQDCILIFSL